MSEIKAWANTVGQQIENMTVDLVAQTAAGVSEASGDVFFVGRPAQNGTDWILKKITPTELEKMVYNYLTSNSIAPQLAAVLGDVRIHGAVSTLDNLSDGFYRIDGSSNVIGMPQGYRTGFLINIGSNSDYIKIQVFLAHKDYFYYRIQVDYTWFGWFKFALTDVSSIE